MFVLRFLDKAGYRRHIDRELNKGERSHMLSRFLFFGKEGAVRGRTFQDQVNTFFCLAVLTTDALPISEGRRSRAQGPQDRARRYPSSAP